jgi:prolyl oligopeptidase
VWSPTGTEYGKWSDPTESSVRAKISSYQNVRPQPHYPPPLITTNTDDEVYPWMARKFVAKMDSLGMPVYYYEGSQGGHYYGLTVEEVALHEAMVFTYFAQRLGIQ